MAYILTGSATIGGMIAFVEPLVGTVAFYIHDKAWGGNFREKFLPFKTATFAAVHFTVALSVSYLLTDDILVGSLLALIEPSVNVIAYHLHERIWLKEVKLG